MVTFKDSPEIDASSLVEAGILDKVKTPITGEDKHPAFLWDKVRRVSVQAGYFSVKDSAEMPHPSHKLLIDFKGKRRRHPGEQIPFVLGILPDGGYGVATVSGTRAGLAPLGEHLSSLVSQLLAQSLDEGVTEQTTDQLPIVSPLFAEEPRDTDLAA